MAHTPGPWCFEPHNAFGTTFLGEQWPFGYISQSSPPVPIFGLDPVLEYPVAELEANVRLMATAPELADAGIEILGAFAEGVVWNDEQRAAYEKLAAALEKAGIPVPRDAEAA